MKKAKELRLGEKVELTVIEIHPQFHIAILQSKNGERYVMDVAGRGPIIWQDQSVQTTQA